MNLNSEDVMQLFVLIGVLTVIVNIITEVLKMIFKKLSGEIINMIVLVESIALTVAVFKTYCTMIKAIFFWYYILGAVVLGFFVAFAAMFGYNKLIFVLKNSMTFIKGATKDD